MLRKKRNKRRLNLYRLIILLVSVVVMSYALAASQSNQSASDAAQPTTLPAQESERRESNLSEPFVPKEKVSADRAVSFPTDI